MENLTLPIQYLAKLTDDELLTFARWVPLACRRAPELRDLLEDHLSLEIARRQALETGENICGPTPMDAIDLLAWDAEALSNAMGACLSLLELRADTPALRGLIVRLAAFVLGAIRSRLHREG